MALNTFTILYNLQNYLVPKFFHCPSRSHISIKLSFLNLPFLLPLYTTNLLSAFMNLPILDISYKWKHSIYLWILCLLYCFQYDWLLCVFLWLNYSSWFECNTFCSSICSVMNICIVSTFCLFCIMLPWTFTYTVLISTF
jgi:hypothetical protein